MDRIDKFVEDQTKVLLSANSASKTGKINGEIGRLKSWLIKHQDETIPDNGKAKLLSILDKYNRAMTYFIEITDNVISLYEDYLQLPEGKLLSSKDKMKVMTWLNNANISNNNNNDEIKEQIMSNITSWFVEEINESSHTITLLNCDNMELWKENFIVDESTMMQIKTVKEKNEQVVIEIDEATQCIVNIRE